MSAQAPVSTAARQLCSWPRASCWLSPSWLPGPDLGRCAGGSGGPAGRQVPRNDQDTRPALGVLNPGDPIAGEPLRVAAFRLPRRSASLFDPPGCVVILGEQHHGPVLDCLIQPPGIEQAAGRRPRREDSGPAGVCDQLIRGNGRRGVRGSRHQVGSDVWLLVGDDADAVSPARAARIQAGTAARPSGPASGLHGRVIS